MILKKLRNDVLMPQVGLGVYKMTNSKETVNAVGEALKVGYRAIDTASYYKNEKEVGEAIRKSGIPREDLFITTKVWNDEQGYDETLRAFDRSLSLLGLDYIDLYLTHWPLFDKFIDTYRAIEKLYEERLIRVPGVSNHHKKHLLQLENKVNVMPMVNQVECHPYLQQRELKDFCKERAIAVTAWAPLGKGTILQDELIKELAQKYDRTPAQIVLRWHLECDTIIIPKSVTPSRIKENFKLFDFFIEKNDLDKLANLEHNGRIGADPSIDDDFS
ncbi:aldo/keto reductase [Oceanobacillus jeddahense]|uniref:aldo/keto reductase n=1 Tax=Oceanobacillus jeddahense TaxID=1462527 RepID=UPI00364564C5